MRWTRTSDDAPDRCPGCDDTGVCGESDERGYCSCQAGESQRFIDSRRLARHFDALIETPKPTPAKVTMAPRRRRAGGRA